jgi:membrane protein implicated in regulation of membrane protease activity
MAKVFFNPLNYWLILTAALVVIDRFTGDRLHFVLAGVASFAAAFLASVSLGPAWQIGAFVIVSVALLKFGLRPLQEMRRATLDGVDKAFEWFHRRDVLVIEEIRAGRPGRVVVGGHVMAACSPKRIPAGTKVEVVKVGPRDLLVRSAAIEPRHQK